MTARASGRSARLRRRWRLHDHARYLPQHLAGAAEGDREAQQIAAAAACDVFGVRPLAEDATSGLTVSERIELLMAFDLYLLTVKRKRRAAVDTAQLYGVDAAALARIDYEQYVGLWLNRHRATIRAAEIQRLGFAASQSQSRSIEAKAPELTASGAGRRFSLQCQYVYLLERAPTATEKLRVGATPLDAFGPSENWIDLNTAADADGVLQNVQPPDPLS